MTKNNNQLAVILPADKTVPYQHLYGAFGTFEKATDGNTYLVYLDADIVRASHLFSKERDGKPIRVKAKDVVVAESSNPLIMASLKATLISILAISLQDSHGIAMKKYLAQATSQEDRDEISAFNQRCLTSITAYRELITADTPTKYQSVNFAARTNTEGHLSQVFYMSDNGVSEQFKAAKAANLYQALSIMFNAAQTHHENGRGVADEAVLLWHGRFELQIHNELPDAEFVAFLASNAPLMNYIFLAANAVFDMDSSATSIEQAIALISRSPFATNPYFLRTATH